ncbi:MAG TPA: KEOPS complex subunit Cgi121 [Nitrososphaerales archaeon]|nr:KEOPS complex subunit Cgi121 [Nitrososphaerales archaeon]
MELAELRRRHTDLAIQAVRPGCIENETLGEMLGEQTAMAKKTGALLAKTPEIDLLLRVAGTRQISEAIKEIGTRRKEGQTILALGAERDLSELEKETGIRGRVKSRPLSEEELDRVERAALLSVG